VKPCSVMVAYICILKDLAASIFRVKIEAAQCHYMELQPRI